MHLLYLIGSIVEKSTSYQHHGCQSSCKKLSIATLCWLRLLGTFRFHDGEFCDGEDQSIVTVPSTTHCSFWAKGLEYGRRIILQRWNWPQELSAHAMTLTTRRPLNSKTASRVNTRRRRTVASSCLKADGAEWIWSYINWIIYHGTTILTIVFLKWSQMCVKKRSVSVQRARANFERPGYKH